MNSRNVDTKGERELIRRIRQLDSDSLTSTADDMGLLPHKGGTILWSTDMLMDGVDFRSDQHDWITIGRKALGVNLSDCAAMASRPLGALCAVSLNDALTMDNALDLHRGVREMGLQHGCPLLGGDTNSWAQPTVICVSVAASMPPGMTPITRNGARIGDHVCVTGPLGGSILGRHLSVAPRIDLALRIAQTLSPTAMIDISDGLATDLHHICAESGRGAIVEEDRLARMVHADAVRLSKQTGRPPIDHAWFDGEDFELIVTTPAAAPADLIRSLGLTVIGAITQASGVRVRAADGGIRPIPSRGWEHFQ